ncbi:MAG: M48 family metalloprotease [Rikenellaceae bacterium]|nr:M48 family metalloprotease [Rikenellaceae bacterium]
MKTILILCLEMLVCGAVFHLLYRTAFEGRVRFVGCRIYLIVVAALSAIIPALDIRLWRDRIVYIEATALNSTTTADTVAQSTFDLWATIIICAYAIGVLVVITSVISQAVKIARLGTATIENGQRIVRSAKIDTPFSFLRTIYLPTSLAPEHCEVVIQHECAHIRHHHSLERIAMELMKAVLWFNPFVWLFSRLLTEVHEFEADREVIDSGFDNRLYATSIFTQAFGFSPDIANGLQSSLTKKRFKMMTKQRPSTRSLLRLAAALPVVATLAMLFSVRAQATVYLPVEKQSPESAADFTEVRTYSAEPVLSAADSTKLREYRAEPAVPFMLVEDKTTNEEEAVPFLLVDDKDNKDDEAVPFLLVDDEKKKELKYKDIAFVKADKMPTFDGRGNINDFINWCSTQLNYNNGTAGMRVVMHFVVETDGSIKEVYALQGDAKSCAEVERVIRLSSGKWSSGEQKGEKVRVSYTIPVKFVQ